MSEWIKKGNYYAQNEAYLMSWNDAIPKVFVLYFRKEYLISGTRKECLEQFDTHRRLPASHKIRPEKQTNEQWLEAYNREHERLKKERTND